MNFLPCGLSVLAVGIVVTCLPRNGWAQAQQPAIDRAAIAAAEAKANKQADEAAAKAAKAEREQEPKPAPKPTREDLMKERKNALRQVDVGEGMLNARSYNSRVDIFCRGEMSRRDVPGGGRSGEEWEAAYRKVLSEEGKTREEEVERQGKLNALGVWVEAYEGSVQECKAFIWQGLFIMPSDADELEKIKAAKAAIARVDRLLAQGR